MGGNKLITDMVYTCIVVNMSVYIVTIVNCIIHIYIYIHTYIICIITYLIDNKQRNDTTTKWMLPFVTLINGNKQNINDVPISDINNLLYYVY